MTTEEKINTARNLLDEASNELLENEATGNQDNMSRDIDDCDDFVQTIKNYLI